MSKTVKPHWPDEVRLKMIEKSEFYSEPQVYQYGFYDGFQHAQSQTQELQEQNRELVDMYKECFEMFIPSDKWEEATEFLSTYGSGLAKDLCKKEKHNHLNKKP